MYLWVLLMCKPQGIDLWVLLGIVVATVSSQAKKVLSSRPMNLDDLNAFRRERMAKLVERMGSRVALGRALGYKDGNYINHMLNGLRPITEKTVLQCEQLPGMSGWFAVELGAPSAQATPRKFETFGARLHWWMIYRGFTQVVLADRVGMAQATLNELIKGKIKEPRASHFLELARVLDLHPEYLLTGEGPMELMSFSQLTGPEAQLVMFFRSLANDAEKNLMLIQLHQEHEKRGRSAN
nr:hypothetical protein [Delftia sp. PE138]